MDIDYNLYKIFLYLFEEKSISKTANKMYVSQPAISYSLKELETQLGYPLFYRNSKGIEPTLEAKELYHYVSTAFHILDDALEHIKNLNQLNTGCIRIGIPPYLGTFFLEKTIRVFRKEYPGITFEFVSSPSNKMLELLETRKLDLVFDVLPIETKKNIQKIVLARFPNCFAYDKNHFDLAIKKLEDLEQYPIILPSKNSSIRSKLEEWVESKNGSISPTVEVWSSQEMFDMVKSGVGIGYFIKDSIPSNTMEVISCLDCPSVDICVLFIEDFLTTASKKFVEAVKDKDKSN